MVEENLIKTFALMSRKHLYGRPMKMNLNMADQEKQKRILIKLLKLLWREVHKNGKQAIKISSESSVTLQQEEARMKNSEEKIKWCMKMVSQFHLKSFNRLENKKLYKWLMLKSQVIKETKKIQDQVIKKKGL